MSSGGPPKHLPAATAPATTGCNRTQTNYPTNSVTTPLPLTLTATCLTPASITLLTLLMRRSTLSQPPRNKLRITRKPIQLNRILTSTRRHRTKIRLTHPITLLMQHPIRRIHPQPTPRPRTPTRNHLRSTQVRDRRLCNTVGDTAMALRSANGYPHEDVLNETNALNFNVNAIDFRLAFQPDADIRFSLRHQFIGVQQPGHSQHSFLRTSPVHHYLLMNGRLLVTPCSSTLRTVNFIGTLSVGFTSPNLVTESAFVGGPSYSIVMSMLRCPPGFLTISFSNS